jgi:hypothetical protein
MKAARQLAGGLLVAFLALVLPSGPASARDPLPGTQVTILSSPPPEVTTTGSYQGSSTDCCCHLPSPIPVPVPVRAAPEPATLLSGLIGTGLMTLYAARRRKQAIGG